MRLLPRSLNERGRGAERTESPAVGSSSGTVPVQKGLGWGPYLEAKADIVGTHGHFRGNLNRGFLRDKICLERSK